MAAREQQRRTRCWEEIGAGLCYALNKRSLEEETPALRDEAPQDDQVSRSSASQEADGDPPGGHETV